MVYTLHQGVTKEKLGAIGVLLISIVFAFAMSLGAFNRAGAEINAVTPSTNEINKTNGWAHFNVLDTRVGEVDVEFVSTRSFGSCFEYRTDGDTTQVLLLENGGDNYNANVSDGLYPYYCQNNNSRTETIAANEYVEIRMVFGAETDERFDWTRVNVLYDRNAEITAPLPDENVHGSVNFAAYLDDDDVDAVQWAVRKGTCAAGTNTVFGNVDGHSDVAAIDTSDTSNQTFSFTGDMSAEELGRYCFIYNPVEDAGETNIRLTVEFNLVETPAQPVVKDDCKKDGWQTFGFRNQGLCIQYVNTGRDSR